MGTVTDGLSKTLLRLAATGLVLLGLFAMHGLTLDHAVMTPISAPHSMSFSEPNPAEASPSTTLKAEGAAMAAHPQCVATRPTDPAQLDGSLGAGVPVPAPHPLVVEFRGLSAEFVPPVSLTRLCISRT